MRVVKERELRSALRRGRQLQPGSNETVTLSSDLLRKVILEKGLSIDPRGLRLKGLTIRGNLDLQLADLPQIDATDCAFEGWVNVSAAHVRGRLALRGCQIKGVDESGYSLTIAGADVQGALVISDTDVAQRFRCVGAVRISSARVGGTCLVRGADIQGIAGDTGFSLLADLLTTSGPFYGEGLTAAGSVSLVAATVGNQVNLSKSHLGGVTKKGCSIQADTLSTNGPFYGLHMELAGGISFISARLGAELILDGTTMSSSADDGFSLTAASATIAGEVSLYGVISPGGCGWRGAVVERLLDLSGAHFSDESLAIVDLSDARLDRLRLDKSLGKKCRLRCDSVTISRLELQADPRVLPQLEPMASWRVHSFVGPVTDDRKAMATWLSKSWQGTQPWYEVAAFMDRIGRPSEARRMRHQAERLVTKDARTSRRYGSWIFRTFSDLTTGYGFYPICAIFWLLGLALAATFIANCFTPGFTTSATADLRTYLAVRYGGAGDVPARLSAADCEQGRWPINCFNPVQFGIGAAFPVANIQQPWEPPLVLAYALNAMKALSWVLTALFIAGITGLLRRSGSATST